jgi:hypothetical protein
MPNLHEKELNAIQWQLGTLCYGAEGNGALVGWQAADELHKAQDGNLLTQTPFMCHQRRLPVEQRCVLGTQVVIAMDVTCLKEGRHKAEGRSLGGMKGAHGSVLSSVFNAPKS